MVYAKKERKMAISEMSVIEVSNKLDADSVFIDVREPSEYAEVHAKGVKNIPLATVSAQNIGEENKDKTIYLICRSGKRSMTAAERLASEGFNKLVNVEGGTIAWVAAGLASEN